ncbi:MAG: uncharacterized membrane protein (UPF0127 family) [Kangiellaceae bacterium]|jgi:uncharacterized membrane protein (UPF0127 family)
MLTTSSKSLLVVIGLLCVLSASACAKPTNAVDTLSQEKQASRPSPSQDGSTNVDAMSDVEVDAWLRSQTSDNKIALTVSTTNIRVEYADTPQKRQLGLMFRRELCENCGMLFKFDSPRIGSIWMKNTFIPLDLAYIDEQGNIVDIEQLQPHDLNPVGSSAKVLYALEMNKGWFAKQDIRVGDKVTLLP